MEQTSLFFVHRDGLRQVQEPLDLATIGLPDHDGTLEDDWRTGSPVTWSFLFKVDFWGKQGHILSGETAFHGSVARQNGYEG